MSLKDLLQQGSVLAGQSNSSTPKATNLSEVLRDRLQKQGQTPAVDASEEALKWQTAQAALNLLVSVRSDFNALQSKDDSIPAFGSRDIKVISTLASIVARWGLAALLDHDVLPDELKDQTPKGKITETTTGNLQEVVELAAQTLNISWHDAELVQPEELLNLILPQYIPLLLPALLQLRHSGWPGAAIILNKILEFLSPSVTISMLMLLTKPGSAPWLITEASQLLSQQLTRHEGVYCLLRILVPEFDDG